MRTRARSVRVIQQMEAVECGAACLSMLLDYYGQSRSLSEMRALCKTSRDGNSALDLLEAARELGLEGRGLSVSLPGLRALRKPAILHWAFNHFVVLERCRRDGFIIVDPASGRRKVSTSELSRLFSGVALDLGPGPAFAKRKRKSMSLARYALALRGQRGTLMYVLLANLIQQILAVSMPAASQVLIDHVIQPHRGEWLWPVMLTLSGASLAQVILQRLQGVSQSILHSSLGMALAKEMGERLIRLPLPFLESRSHGDLLERVNMQGELQDVLAQTVQSVFDVLLVALLIALMLTYDPFLGGVSLALTTARVAIMRWVRRPIAQRMAAELAARGREAGALVESTCAIEMTQGFGVEQGLKERYAQRVRERTGWSIGSARLEVGLTRSMTVLSAVMHAMVLWFGGRQVIEGEMTIGVFSGFLAIRAMMGAPIESVMSLVEHWIRVRGMLERCDDVLDVAPAPDPRGPIPPELRGRIELQNLGFRFSSGGPWIFRNVDLTIEAGQHVAITGASGQGKSTLGKLLCGLLEPTEGRVVIDGRDIRDCDREALARQLGVVLQEPLIMEGPVVDALAIRSPACSHDELVNAAELACFDEVVREMPNGYESRLEAMGANLSGGERQRLAIAQAVLLGPRILLLDEGTCSLDAALERRVMNNLSRLRATIVSVAHRRAVVEYAERLFVVSAGQVLEASRESAALGHTLEAEATCLSH